MGHRAQKTTPNSALGSDLLLDNNFEPRGVRRSFARCLVLNGNTTMLKPTLLRLVVCMATHTHTSYSLADRSIKITHSATLWRGIDVVVVVVVFSRSITAALWYCSGRRDSILAWCRHSIERTPSCLYIHFFLLLLFLLLFCVEKKRMAQQRVGNIISGLLCATMRRAVEPFCWP